MPDYQCIHCNDRGGLCCDWFFSPNLEKKVASMIYTSHPRGVELKNESEFLSKAKSLILAASENGVVTLPNGRPVYFHETAIANYKASVEG